MHRYTLDRWQHPHRFHINHDKSERSTHRVIALTLIMMVVEIGAGLAFGSMALLADGWHMGTHAVALGITALAYYFARRHADNPRFTFGTGKVGELGGFASAVVLAVVAIIMAAESVQRLISPHAIRFNEAIAVAVAGLIVNVISAFMLQDRHAHDHEHGRGHGRDHNIKAAYLHVLADALTSLLAIVALLAGKAFGWVWMDPLMGIVGAVIITRWAYGLLMDTGGICSTATWTRSLFPPSCSGSKRSPTTGCPTSMSGGSAPAAFPLFYRLSPTTRNPPSTTNSCWRVLTRSRTSPWR